MELTLEEVRQEKEWELNAAAEEAFWQAINEPGLFPMMSMLRLLIIVATSKRNLATAERTRLEAAFQVTEKLKAKKVSLAAATTIEQVRAIVWDDAVVGGNNGKKN